MFMGHKTVFETVWKSESSWEIYDSNLSEAV